MKQNAAAHITDAQLQSLAWQLKQWSEQFRFPLDLAHLPEHKDIPPGIAEGRTDCGLDYTYERLEPFLK